MPKNFKQSSNPKTLFLQKADRQSLSQALEKLPPNFREVLVLREIEGLSYKEIAYVAGIPIGSVMSGLARARERLRQSLSHLSNSAGLSRSASPSEAYRE
jgi:RNA polymerase sigma-70 factor, ECF subfamily